MMVWDGDQEKLLQALETLTSTVDGLARGSNLNSGTAAILSILTLSRQAVGALDGFHKDAQRDEGDEAAKKKKKDYAELKKTIADSAVKIITRLRKINVKSKELCRIRALTKAAALYLAWTRTEVDTQEGLEERVLLSAKAAAELFDEGMEDTAETTEACLLCLRSHELLSSADDDKKSEDDMDDDREESPARVGTAAAAATPPTVGKPRAAPRRGSSSNRERDTELASGVFKALEIVIHVMLERGVDASDTAAKVQQLLTHAQSAAAVGGDLIRRAVAIASHAASRLLKAKQYKAAKWTLTSALQTIDTTDFKPVQHRKLLHKVSLLYMLASCYRHLGEMDKALECLSALEEVRNTMPAESASSSSGLLSRSRIELARISCLLSGSLDIAKARQSILALAATDLSSALHAARALACTVSYDLDTVTAMYDDMINCATSPAAATEAASSTGSTLDDLRLDYAKALASAFHCSPRDGQWLRALECLTRLLTSSSGSWCFSSERTRAEVVDMLKRIISATFDNGGDEQWLWTVRLCDVHAGLLPSTDQDEVEKVQCVETHALLELKDYDAALRTARAMHEKSPSSKRAFANLLWCSSVVSASGGAGLGEQGHQPQEAAVLDVLKGLLAKETGADLLHSLIALALMLQSGASHANKTPAAPSSSASHEGMIKAVLQEALQVWVDIGASHVVKLDSLLLAPVGTASLTTHTSTSVTPEQVTFVDALVSLMHICIRSHASRPLPGSAAFSAATFAAPNVRAEVWRFLSTYLSPVLGEELSIVDLNLCSGESVAFLSKLCWNCGVAIVSESSCTVSSSLTGGPTAAGFFLMSFQLSTLAASATSSAMSTSEEQDRDNVLLLMVAITSSMQQDPSSACKVSPSQGCYWLGRVYEAKKKIAVLLKRPSSIMSLARNLERTALVIEILLRTGHPTLSVRASGEDKDGRVGEADSHSLKHLVASSESQALLSSLSPETLHKLALACERTDNAEGKHISSVLLQLALQKCTRPGPAEDVVKALWLHVELFRCASGKQAGIAVVKKLLKLFESASEKEQEVSQAVAQRLASQLYNEGVASLEQLQADAQEFVSWALKLLPYTSSAFQNQYTERLQQVLDISADISSTMGDSLGDDGATDGQATESMDLAT